MFNLKTLAAAASLSLTATAGAAATVYATEASGVLISSGVEQSCSVASRSTSRADLCNGLGAEDVDGAFQLGGFVSAGKFESITFKFGTAFTAPATVWEVTGGGVNNTNYVELVDILLKNSVTGSMVSAVLQNTHGTGDGPNRWRVVYDDSDDQVFDMITFTDGSNTADGFDIDAVSVSAVPLPAGALLLLGGLGGLVAMRRRKG